MMKKTSASTVVAVAVLAAVLVGAFYYWNARRGAPSHQTIDLLERFPDADKQTTMARLEDGYAIQTVTIDDDRKRSLFAHPTSHVTWKVVVPGDAVLQTFAAIRPDAWRGEGDGGLFKIGIRQGSQYTEYFRQYIQPASKPADRRWFPIEIDLSRYAGDEVEVVFVTEPGDVGNAVLDACVWGTPRIVTRSGS